MDHLPAQATFVEITFAVNLLFATYSAFRDYLMKHLAKKIEEAQAIIKVLEISSDRLNVLDNLNTIVRQYAAQFEKAQQKCVCIATGISLVAAAGCVAVVFWDLLTEWGHHTSWLLLPLPAYFLASGCNYLVFRCRVKLMLRRFRKYRSEFDPPPMPPSLS
jgi:hypothetical protein